MERQRLKIATIALAAISGLTGCNLDAGFQGGLVPTKFLGLKSAVAISPDSLQLAWDPLSGASSYKLYDSTKNNPVLTPNYTTVILQPDPPHNATTQYSYSVTAVDNTGKEIGDRTRYLTTPLLPHFNFKTEASVSALSETQVRIAWTGKPLVTYRFFQTERNANGSVNYALFASSIATVTGVSSVVIDNLLPGHEYCFIGVASYSDHTNDGPDGSALGADVDVGSILSSSAWMIGTNNSFLNSKIHLSQKCARTASTSAQSISAIKVYSPKATLSLKPTFYVGEEGTTGDLNIETSVYRVNPTSVTALYLGKRTGNGPIQSNVSHDPGRYQYYAIATKLNDADLPQAKVEVTVNNVTPDPDQTRNYVYVRNFTTPVAPADDSGYYPPKMQDGKGSQQAGASVAMGDFNCDGKMDMAVGIPDYMTIAADGKPAKLGKVLVYYDVSTGSPDITNANTKFQSITFDLTAQYSTSTRDLRLGTNLYANNFNNDNEVTNQDDGISGRHKKYSCDDLAMGSGAGPIFVLFGKRSISGSLGGLNYVNSTSFTINPSSNCDDFTNICQPSAYLQQAGTTFTTISSITSGDYNGDGYQDLALATTSSGIWMFRASKYGLVPPSVAGFPTGPMASYPALTYSAGNFPSGTFGLGSALGTIANAYYDSASNRMRDLFIVGSAGSVGSGYQGAYYCKATGDLNGRVYDPTDSLKYDYGINPSAWSCVSMAMSTAGFGRSMANIKNALRYSPAQLCSSGNVVYDSANIEDCVSYSGVNDRLGRPGAVAISATRGSGATGKVYVYYAVASPPESTSPINCSLLGTRARRGCNLNAYMTSLFASTSTAATSPCTTTGSGGSKTESCMIQEINHPVPSMLGGFGTKISTFPGNLDYQKLDGTVLTEKNQEKDTLLAVAAPYKSVVLGDTTYKDVGTVQVYQQNSYSSKTTFGTVGDYIDRYSDGFSSSLTFSIDYALPLMSNVNFGLGGIAGGPTGIPGDQANASSDILVGAPGYSKTVNTSTKVYSSGSAFMFFSHAGTYRTYPQDGAPGSIAQWHSMDYNDSPENSIKYHQAISMGDLVKTGVDSVGVRISQGAKNKIRIFSGATTRVGLTNEYLDLSVPGDQSAGIRMVPVGNITNGQYPAFLITGAGSSYLYFTGVTGIILGTPSSFSTGGAPRRLTNEGDANYLNFSDTAFYNSEQTGYVDSLLSSLASFTHGDFNGDGFEDIAIGMKTSDKISTYPLSGGSGRVMIFYGGADNGIQTQPDTTGGFPLDTSKFVTEGVNSGFGNGLPCHPTVGYPTNTCKIQMLAGDSDTLSYGRSLTAMPIGNCSVIGSDGSPKDVPVHALAVSTQTSAGSRIEIYKPKCIQNGDKSGLVTSESTATRTLAENTDGNTALGISMTAISPLTQVSSNPTVKYMPSITKTGVASGGITSHLVATEGYWSSSANYSYKLKVFPVNTSSSSVVCTTTTVPTTIDGNSFGPMTATGCGAAEIIYSGLNLFTSMNYDPAFGTSAAAGDINGDGYADLSFSVSKMQRKESSGNVETQGAAIVLFGGPTGFQTKTGNTWIEPSREATCYQTSGAGKCNPTMIFLPSSTTSVRDGGYDRLTLNPYSFLNFGSVNEGLGSLLLGSPNRDTIETDSTARILNAGAYYVLP